MKIKLYLLSENGDSPCFGDDEVAEVENIQKAKIEYAHHLVNGGAYEFSGLLGYDVSRNGLNYKVEADII